MSNHDESNGKENEHVDGDAVIGEGEEGTKETEGEPEGDTEGDKEEPGDAA